MARVGVGRRRAWAVTVAVGGLAGFVGGGSTSGGRALWIRARARGSGQRRLRSIYFERKCCHRHERYRAVGPAAHGCAPAHDPAHALHVVRCQLWA
jgi:hypothetical protein